MKPVSTNDPHDTLDELIAAALHGELTPAERAQWDSRLQTDPAAQAAYQDAKLMHDLLEKTHQTAQPDPAFEQRMVSGVRRKLQTERHRETAWESLVILWTSLRNIFRLRMRSLWIYSGVCSVMLVFFLGFLVMRGNRVQSVFSTISSQLAVADNGKASQTQFDELQATHQLVENDFKTRDLDKRLSWGRANTYTGGPSTITGGRLAISSGATTAYAEPSDTTTPQGGTIRGSAFQPPATPSMPAPVTALSMTPIAPDVAMNSPAAKPFQANNFNVQAVKTAHAARALDLKEPNAAPSFIAQNGRQQSVDIVKETPVPTAPAPDTRKLIRNAQLDLQVKSFQNTMDAITELTKQAGGYVDTSNSQKGGNGKLQGTVVVKVLPQNLDSFLFKLRDLGLVQNQSVSTDDVTKDYFDTQARLDNSRRMEAQLQDLLKHANSKVSDLLQVERELGRVRGEIEQMQGQLKLYDFQVQYATVTMNVSEKDLNQTAAYLLKEQDDFSLFATDVEGTFQKARAAADTFKAQVLTANLNHNSGSDVSAEIVVMVAPDQIESFLGQVRSLGRVANFTRQTQRVAKDGGDSSQPADQTLTEKDKVQVHLAIRSDDESRKQVALTVVTKAVDDALDQAKAAALAHASVEILSSSLNKTPEGQSSAQLSVRVPGSDYAAVIGAFEALGRTGSLSIQRNDNSGPGANGDDAPVIVTLALTDDDTPLQETQMSVVTTDVDKQSQQIKKDAAAANVEVKASSFQRLPDGTELAQMTFRLPMSQYPAFVDTLKKLGQVESLSVNRSDRPDQTRTDETAPAEISLQLHNQADIVADNDGLGATLRKTFGEGASALFGSVRVIGVVIAFTLPWLVTIVLLAWIGRRIYIWRKK